MAQLNGRIDTQLRQRAAEHGDATAFLQKRHGVWTPWSWRRASERVSSLASGLRAAGLAAGEPVGIVSGARVEAVLAVHACHQRD